ncbi:hypothetical protein ACQYRI_10005 [Salmonella enterica]
MAVSITRGAPLVSLFETAAAHASVNGRVKSSSLTNLMERAVNTPNGLSKQQFEQVRIAAQGLCDTLAQQHSKQFDRKSTLIDNLVQVARQNLSPEAAKELAATEKSSTAKVEAKTQLTDQKTVHFRDVKVVAGALGNCKQSINATIDKLYNHSGWDFPGKEVIKKHAGDLKNVYQEIETLKGKMAGSTYDHHPAKTKTLDKLSAEIKATVVTLYTEFWKASDIKDSKALQASNNREAYIKNLAQRQERDAVFAQALKNNETEKLWMGGFVH